MLNASIILLTFALGAPPDGAIDQEQPDRYETIELRGFRGLIRADWARSNALQARRVLAALDTDLAAVEAAVPGPALDLLRGRTTIWISPSLTARTGFAGRGMCFHESEAWVTENGLGRERFRGIEICNADDYLLWRAEQPMMVLHELAHAYHAAIRPGDDEVRAAFAGAVADGKYEAVAHVLAGPGELRRAYAITNDREYFAELTEAYFGRNDFAPFTRESLAEFDPDGLRAIERAWMNPPARAERPAP